MGPSGSDARASDPTKHEAHLRAHITHVAGHVPHREDSPVAILPKAGAAHPEEIRGIGLRSEDVARPTVQEVRTHVPANPATVVRGYIR